MKAGVLEVYSTKSGAVVVKNPVKLRILHVIGGSSRSFEDIVSSVARAKATVSVHLADLKRAGLVGERGVGGDRRKKAFYLAGRFAGAARPAATTVRSFVRTGVANSVGDPFFFMSSLFRTVRYSLEAMGLNTDPAIKAAGAEVGGEIAKTFRSASAEGVAAELSRFWGVHRLGRMSVSRNGPLTLTVRDCVSNRNSPNFGRSMCALTEGMIEAIFAGRLGRGCKVRESECFGTGHPHCRFVVTLAGETL